MSVTTTDLDAIQASAAAVIRCLPVPSLVLADVTEGEAAVATALADPESVAVIASLSGSMTGQIAIVLSRELAAQVEDGPVGPQELVAGLEVALTDATAALAAVFGDVRHEAAQNISAEIALSGAASHELVAAVPFSSSGEQVGALVILSTMPVAGASSAFDALSDQLSNTGATVATGVLRGVELLNDVEMGVTAELGRTRMTVRELLAMQPGSVVELDRAAGSPVDVLVNGTIVARGEVVVVDEEFGVRITEIIGYDAKGK